MSNSGVSFALIGPGRAGQSLLNALRDSRWGCQRVYGRGDDIAQAAQDVDVVILAVSDSAIASVAKSVLPSTSTAVLHLSGAKTLDVLAPHSRRGSCHPLVSLPDSTIGAARLLDNTAFAVAGDPLSRDLADTLGGRWFVVEEAERALYHATAAIASNHLVALCAQVHRLAGHLKMPAELYHTLMVTTLQNVAASGPLAALTGPAARGDIETISSHLDALDRVDSHEGELYRVWAAEATRLGSRVDVHPDMTEGASDHGVADNPNPNGPDRPANG